MPVLIGWRDAVRYGARLLGLAVTLRNNLLRNVNFFELLAIRHTTPWYQWSYILFDRLF